MSTKPYKVWDVPPTKEQLKEYMDEGGRLENVIVLVSLSEIIDGDLEDFLTKLAERAGVPLLADICYSIEGHNEDDLYINVSGDASCLLDEEWA
jgi:hypothetical protein